MEIPSDILIEAEKVSETYKERKSRLRRDAEIYMAASVIVVAYEQDHPLTLSEVSEFFDAETKMVARAKTDIMNVLGRHALPAPANSFIERYAETLSLPPEVEERSRKVAKTRGPDGHHPSIVAAASIYLACLDTEDPFSQEEVADAAGTHMTSIRKCYAKLQ